MSGPLQEERDYGRIRRMSNLVGTPSDEIPAVLATGGCNVKDIFVSMSSRHPEGKDADHLRWHTFDHRPEQYRLASIRASLRLVSTPQCRTARAVSKAQYDAVDHVMTYFFTDSRGFGEFNDLAAALGPVGGSPVCCPSSSAGCIAWRAWRLHHE